VGVTDLGSQHREEFALLGAWDSDPAKGVISYLTPVAQALLNHAPGDEVEFELEGVKRRFRIDTIAPAVRATAATAGAGPESTVAGAGAGLPVA
jgi:transcription elongation GreA/GreB family factor